MSQTANLQVSEFMALFRGNNHAYGQHAYAYKESGKEEGKNSTVREKLLTMEQYKAHLNGEMGLGIIPIGDDNKCFFGVIDVDVYDGLAPYIEAIERSNIPLVPFRSKSGGLHLYAFLKAPTDAKAVVEVLGQFSVLLGLDLLVKQRNNKMIELFPKQHKLQEGGIGNWINLPYYNAKAPKQYAVKGGEPLSFDDALAYAKDKRKTIGELRAFLADVAHGDGPPCLQTIMTLNDTSANSGRNNYLFSFAVYLKKKDPDFWEQKLFEINAGLRDPLPKEEVEGTIISSLRKKDYTYKCFDAPCSTYCRRPLCKTREYGIGKEGGYFSELEYGKMRQYRTSEPYYEWEVKVQGSESFVMLRFHNEEEIIKQDMFLRLCFRELHLLPIKMKQSEWFKLVNTALAELEVVAVDREDDTSPHALFRTLFVDFIANRAMAQTRMQIMNKRVYHDKAKDCYYFRTQDLVEFVFVGKSFRYFAPSDVHALMKDLHVKQSVRIKTESGKQFRVNELSVADFHAVLTAPSEEPFKAQFTVEEERF